MPQMAPLNWLTLFLLFIMILMLFNCMNYFSFMYLKNNSLNKTFINKINWKW